MDEQMNADAPSESALKKEIGKTIVVSFHEQFAQNQNHHQKLFLQVLAVLLSVIAGFAYLYVRVDTKSPELTIKIETLYYYLGLSMVLLSMAVSLICNMALGFRRDQLMAANIRVITNVMDPNSNESYFFGSFNPKGKTRLLEWMPEFHLIFFVSLIAVKALLALSVTIYPGKLLTAVYPYSKGTIIVIAVLAVFSFFFDIFIWLHYRCKWKSYSDKAPARLTAKIGT
jgi:hypothetical protein